MKKILITSLIIVWVFLLYDYSKAQDFYTGLKEDIGMLQIKTYLTTRVKCMYNISTTSTDLIINTNYKNAMLNSSGEHIIVNNKIIK